MKQASDSVAKAAKGKAKDVNSLLREIPSVDELLGRPQLVALADRAGRGVVTQAARNVLADLRTNLKSGANGSASAATALRIEAIEARVAADVAALLAPSLGRVINATGVILHTNLGRAPLSASAIAACRIRRRATRISNTNSPPASAASATPTRPASRETVRRGICHRREQQRRRGLSGPEHVCKRR